ncbi:MAG: hypothetical protein J6K62_04915 [Clostridia bacterium]|nr:hypothetical protein [Clostridia bacterium]
MSQGRNMMQMQQEAAERVKRMQERSRRLVQEHPVNVYRGVTMTPPRELPEQQETPCDEPPTACESSLNSGLAALLQGDQEQTLVLLLAVILAKNGAPLELVLALLYVGM